MSVYIEFNSEYTGKHSEKIIFRPLFKGEDVRNFGFKVIMTKQTVLTLTFWDAVRKKLRKYSQGFQGGAGSKRNSKKLVLEEFKVEANYSKQDYRNTVYDEITNRAGVTQNDISGTDVHAAEIRLWQETLQHDIFMTFFLADEAKGTYNGTNYSWLATDATFDADGAITAGGKDIRYNVINGLWAEVFDNIKNEAAADKIKRITVANGAVAQVTTANYTSLTAGTVGIDVNGLTLDVPFISSIAQTLADWVAAHQATIQGLTPGITATDSTSPLLTFTSDTPGAPMLLANVTGTNADGTITDTTPNTLASTSLAADEAFGYFQQAVEGARPELRSVIRKGNAEMLITQSFWDNYKSTLSTGDPTALESMRDATQNGMLQLMYDGIPLRIMEIDGLLEEDTANEYPHRAILSTPDNIALVLNGSEGKAETKMWFNNDENENRQRSQFEMNADFLENRLMVAIY